jgi:hypothetical protein
LITPGECDAAESIVEIKFRPEVPKGKREISAPRLPPGEFRNCRRQRKEFDYCVRSREKWLLDVSVNQKAASQAPSSKPQAPEKLQVPSSKRSMTRQGARPFVENVGWVSVAGAPGQNTFGIWCLVFLWNLELGTWSLAGGTIRWERQGTE